MKEIERKFLVNDFCPNDSISAQKIKQGYISSVPERIVRIRIQGESGFITIKGKGNISRFEWEKEISFDDAQQLILLCESDIIEKTRYRIPHGKHIFEVDVFCGKNEGLIVAEIELQSENEYFERPSWLGEEVSEDPKYYNVSLCTMPFCKWK